MGEDSAQSRLQVVIEGAFKDILSALGSVGDAMRDAEGKGDQAGKGIQAALDAVEKKAQEVGAALRKDLGAALKEVAEGAKRQQRAFDEAFRDIKAGYQAGKVLVDEYIAQLEQLRKRDSNTKRDMQRVEMELHQARKQIYAEEAAAAQKRLDEEIALARMVNNIHTAAAALEGQAGADRRKLLDEHIRSVKSAEADEERALNAKRRAWSDTLNTMGMLENTARRVFSTITGLINSSVQAANEFNAAFTGLNSIAQGMGQDMGAARDAAMALSADGLMTVADAAVSLKNLLAHGFGLEESVRIMHQFKDAAAFNRQGMLDFGQSIRGATEGLKDSRSTLVDNVGITRNLSDMWKEYARQIGVLPGHLSDAQKRQAEINGIMKESQPMMGNAAKLSAQFAGEQARLAADTQKLAAAFGELLIPSLKPAVELLDQGVRGLTRLVSIMEGTPGTIATVTASLAGLGVAAVGLSIGIASIAETGIGVTLMTLSTIAAVVATQITLLVGVFLVAEKAGEGYGNLIKWLLGNMEELEEIDDDMTVRSIRNAQLRNQHWHQDYDEWKQQSGKRRQDRESDLDHELKTNKISRAEYIAKLEEFLKGEQGLTPRIEAERKHRVKEARRDLEQEMLDKKAALDKQLADGVITQAQHKKLLDEAISDNKKALDEVDANETISKAERNRLEEKLATSKKKFLTEVIDHELKMGTISIEQHQARLQQILNSEELSVEERDKLEEQLQGSLRQHRLDDLDHRLKTHQIWRQDYIEGLEQILAADKLGIEERQQLEEKLAETRLALQKETTDKLLALKKAEDNADAESASDSRELRQKTSAFLLAEAEKQAEVNRDLRTQAEEYEKLNTERSRAIRDEANKDTDYRLQHAKDLQDVEVATQKAAADASKRHSDAVIAGLRQEETETKEWARAVEEAETSAYQAAEKQIGLKRQVADIQRTEQQEAQHYAEETADKLIALDRDMLASKRAIAQESQSLAKIQADTAQKLHDAEKSYGDEELQRTRAILKARQDIADLQKSQADQLVSFDVGQIMGEHQINKGRGGDTSGDLDRLQALEKEARSAAALLEIQKAIDTLRKEGAGSKADAEHVKLAQQSRAELVKELQQELAGRQQALGYLQEEQTKKAADHQEGIRRIKAESQEQQQVHLRRILELQQEAGLKQQDAARELSRLAAARTAAQQDHARRLAALQQDYATEAAHVEALAAIKAAASVREGAIAAALRAEQQKQKAAADLQAAAEQQRAIVAAQDKLLKLDTERERERIHFGERLTDMATEQMKRDEAHQDRLTKLDEEKTTLAQRYKDDIETFNTNHAKKMTGYREAIQKIKEEATLSGNYYVAAQAGESLLKVQRAAGIEQSGTLKGLLEGVKDAIAAAPQRMKDFANSFDTPLNKARELLNVIRQAVAGQVQLGGGPVTVPPGGPPIQVHASGGFADYTGVHWLEKGEQIIPLGGVLTTNNNSTSTRGGDVHRHYGPIYINGKQIDASGEGDAFHRIIRRLIGEDQR